MRVGQSPFAACLIEPSGLQQDDESKEKYRLIFSVSTLF